MPPPSSTFISLAAAACKVAVVLATIGYAGVVAHRLRAQNAQLRKEVDEARAERKRFLEEVASQRSKVAYVAEKQEEASFWWRMEGLARSELEKKDAVLKEMEAEFAAQREQIHDLHVDLREARSERSTVASPSPSLIGLRVPEDATSARAEQQFPSVAPAIATTDEVVLHKVRILNLEISEVASQVTNSFHVAENLYSDRATAAFDRAREAVGPVMAELLESIQHQDDPILIDIALKADMVAFAAEITSAWDFQQQTKSLFTGVYKQMRRSEPQNVCAQWRSHTRKYSKQRLYDARDLTSDFVHQLAERIADLLTIAGGASTAQEIYASYTSHLETIVKTALDLQRIAGEEVIACDYEVLAVRIDEVFDAAQMEDIYHGEITAAGPPGMVPQVLSTADLGLRRSQKVGDLEGSASGRERDNDGILTTMLLKPKVVLDTVVYELGLVDEEDASSSTAEPST